MHLFTSLPQVWWEDTTHDCTGDRSSSQQWCKSFHPTLGKKVNKHINQNIKLLCYQAKRSFALVSLTFQPQSHVHTPSYALPFLNIHFSFSTVPTMFICASVWMKRKNEKQKSKEREWGLARKLGIESGFQGKPPWKLTTNEHSCTVNVLFSWCKCKIYLRCTYIQIQINHIIYMCKRNMSLYVKTQSI